MLSFQCIKTVLTFRCIKFQVNMNFDKDSAEPGEEVILKLQASKNSLCFVGMVDKSVTLLAGNNMLLPDKV